MAKKNIQDIDLYAVLDLQITATDSEVIRLCDFFYMLYDLIKLQTFV